MAFLQVIRRWGLLVIVGGGVLAIDQWVKQPVIETLAYGESWEPIPAIASLVRITRSQNTGAAFGMFPFVSDFFLALAINQRFTSRSDHGVEPSLAQPGSTDGWASRSWARSTGSSSTRGRTTTIT